MPIIKKPFSLAPLNDNPVVLSAATDDLSLSGGFSHKQGFPTIKYSIPPQPSMLEMASLKLVGQILVKQADSNCLVAKNNSTDYSNGAIDAGANGRVGNIEHDSGANMIPQTALNLSGFGGVQNVIDKVVIQSKKSLIELSNVVNYGQYAGLTEAYNNNGDDYVRNPLISSLSAGTAADRVNRRLLTCATSTAAAGATSLTGGANDPAIGQFFSMPIKIDILGGQDLLLDDDYLGGLLITIHLAPDSQVFCNRWNRTSGNNTAPNDMSALNYVLKNVRLEGRYIVPDQNDMANVPNQLMLQSRLNLINDVHSSVNANAYTPQLQNVKSIVNVFQDNDSVNTFTKNNNNFKMVVGLKAYQQARNGLRFPYNYETTLKPNIESVVETGTGNVGEKNLEYPVLQYGDAEVRKQFNKSLLDGGVPYHAVASLHLTNAVLEQDDDDGALGGGDSKNNNVIADVLGIGADYTMGLDMIQNFVNQDYNLTLKSAINTGNALVSNLRNGSVTNNPLLQQSFVRYNAVFDTGNLVKII